MFLRDPLAGTAFSGAGGVLIQIVVSAVSAEKCAGDSARYSKLRHHPATLWIDREQPAVVQDTMNTSQLRMLMYFVALSVSTRTQGAVLLDDTAGWNFFNGIEVIGNGSYVTPSFGQSFTVPAGVNAITSFSFWLNDELNSSVLHFTANLVKWNGTAGTGPVLYSSAAQVTTDNHGAGGMELAQFNFAAIPVAPGDQYMAFLSTLGVSSGLTGAAYVGDLNGDVMSGGRAYVNFTTTTVANAVQNGWAFEQPSMDYAFRAQFLAVPEPASVSWLGFVVLTAWGLRRRQESIRRDCSRK